MGQASIGEWNAVGLRKLYGWRASIYLDTLVYGINIGENVFILQKPLLWYILSLFIIAEANIK